MRGNLEDRAKIADQRNKIWQYKIRRLVLLCTLVGVGLTVWDKCGSRKTQASAAVPASTDSASTGKTQQKTQTSSASHKPRHHKPESVAPAAVTNTQPATQYADNSTTPPIERPKPKVTAPLQVANSDNIEFKLVSAVGSSKAQTITMTMDLTTSAANWYIMSYVGSIIDPDGNEYKLKSFTIGASNYIRSVQLVTGVPMRCTYTFGGVLPDVKTVKLFKYDYTHRAGEPFYVEFRDIPVDWR